MIKNSWFLAVGFQMWTCYHSCHMSLWVSVNSQTEAFLLKGIILGVIYLWCPYISFCTIFFLLNQMRQLYFQTLLTLLAVFLLWRDVLPEYSFSSIKLLRSCCIDQAINWLLKTYLKNKSALSLPYKILIPHFLKTQQSLIDMIFICSSWKENAALLLTPEKAEGWTVVNCSVFFYFKNCKNLVACRWWLRTVSLSKLCSIVVLWKHLLCLLYCYGIRVSCFFWCCGKLFSL